MQLINIFIFSDEESGTDTPVNDDSSGGSVSLSILLSLLFVAIRRKFFV
ncbi:GlyGly-CTERM sorting domain-containing protein [Vibrio rotiferianus]